MLHYEGKPYFDGTTIEVILALKDISNDQKIRVYYGRHGVSYNLLHTGYIREMGGLLKLIPRPNANDGEFLFTNMIMRIDTISESYYVTKHYEIKGFTIGVVESIKSNGIIKLFVDGRYHGDFKSEKEVDKYIGFLNGTIYKYKNKY
jgi:hypothetical protein